MAASRATSGEQAVSHAYLGHGTIKKEIALAEIRRKLLPEQPLATYQDALDYLYSFIDYERRPIPSRQDARFNLPRTHALLAAVGNPHTRFASVVVAGTKGKGSTSALLEHMLRAAGYRTGLWTSPHLTSYRERIQVARTLISQPAFVEAMREMHAVVSAFDAEHYGTPTTFEIAFALALRHFAAQQVQVAVVEVGLGGRYDCANAITPLVSVVSSISYDHMKILGSTLTEIASDKAAIFKPGVPAISAPQHPEAAAAIARSAAENGIPLWAAEADALRRLLPAPPAGEPAPGMAYPVTPEPALLRGAFQRENARLALGAALLLREQGLSLPDAALAASMAEARWPGRLEVAGHAPLLVLDGAHNGDSAHKLAAALRAEFGYERLVLVLGTLRDKDLDAMLAALLPHTSTLILTRSRHPRAHTDLDRVAAVAQPYLRGDLHLVPDVPAALDQARALAGSDDLICVTGSLSVVGDARIALGLAETHD
jgi:dihydrofolate synthase/folylpolyglutamate synthase